MNRLFFCLIIVAMAVGCTAIQFGNNTTTGITSDALKVECNSIRQPIFELSAKVDKFMAKQGVTPLTPSEITEWQRRANEAQKKADAAVKDAKTTGSLVHTLKWTIIWLTILSILVGIVLELSKIETGIPAIDAATHALGVVYHVLVAVAHVLWHILKGAWNILSKIIAKVHNVPKS